MINTPTRSRTTFDWGSVSYLEWRPESPTASTVVLLHGGGYDSASLSWSGVGAGLAAAGHRVIAPDHPGYGESPLPAWPCTQQHQLTYLAEFLDALELERYVLGGLSMGGALTLGHVLRRPEAVRAIMLLGSGGVMPRLISGPLSLPVQLLTWLTVRTGLMESIFAWSGRSRRLAGASLRSIVRNPQECTTELLDEVLASGADGSSVRAFAQWQRDQVLPTRLKDDYTDRLGSIGCPALVVHGTHDTGVPVARARRVAQELPDAELLVVDGAGHWVQRDRPGVVMPAMVDFLGAVR